MMILYLASAASVAGLLLSMYIMLLPPPAFCEIGSLFSCDKVLSSPYAYFLGLPTAFYGVVWFALASSSTLLTTSKKSVAKFMSAWSVIGLASISLLIYVEVVLIGSICILCTVAHVLVVAVVVLYYYGSRRS